VPTLTGAKTRSVVTCSRDLPATSWRWQPWIHAGGGEGPKTPSDGRVMEEVADWRIDEPHNRPRIAFHRCGGGAGAGQSGPKPGVRLPRRPLWRAGLNRWEHDRAQTTAAARRPPRARPGRGPTWIPGRVFATGSTASPGLHGATPAQAPAIAAATLRAGPATRRTCRRRLWPRLWPCPISERRIAPGWSNTRPCHCGRLCRGCGGATMPTGPRGGLIGSGANWA
jgi:hypothetical protein